MLFDGGHVACVETSRGGKVGIVGWIRAERAVVFSAGPYGSSHLLLSRAGPGDQLITCQIVVVEKAADRIRADAGAITGDTR